MFDGGAADFERQRAQRRLSTFTTDDGIVGIDVRLDPVAGATVKATIDRFASLWRADAEGGARTIGLSARRADALVELCRRAGVGENDVAKRVGPTVVVVIDHQTLLGQLPAQAGLRTDRRHAPTARHSAPPGVRGRHPPDGR